MVRMAEFDMVNGILLTGNLVIWVALCLRRGESAVWGRMGALRTKAAGAKGAAGTLPHGGGNGAQGDRGIGRGAGNGRLAAPEARFAESLVGFLEFAVYGAGMIRMADLILQGIAGPGGESGALFAVRVLLAESMLLLFPLWRMLHRWKAEEDGAGMRGAWDGCGGTGGIPSAGKPWGEKRPDWNRPGTMGAAAGFWQGWRDALLEEVSFSDRVLVMKAGRVESLQTPQELFQRPDLEDLGLDLPFTRQLVEMLDLDVSGYLSEEELQDYLWELQSPR